MEPSELGEDHTVDILVSARGRHSRIILSDMVFGLWGVAARASVSIINAGMSWSIVHGIGCFNI